MKKFAILAGAAALAVSAPVAAQTSTSPRDVIGSILGSLLGGRNNVNQTVTLDTEWSAGRTPLTSQRAAFEAKVDSAVASGSLTSATALRLKSDYYELTRLEGQYGADARFTTQERADLTDKYGRLTQILSDGRYGDGATANVAEVANGQADFNKRVDAQVSARKLSRTTGSRIKSDYAAVIATERGYMSDGVLTEAERADLDSRLDALDMRVGDISYASTITNMTPRARLAAVMNAIPASGLTAAAQAQLRTEYEDVSRLEMAYARLNTTADERAYLEKRLVDLETDVRLRR